VNGQVTYVADPDDYHLYEPFYHEPGCRNMDGWAALDYSRQRYGVEGADYARQRHQQQLIKAMATKASSTGVLTDPGKVQDLIVAVGESLLLDINWADLEDFIFTLRDIATADLLLLKTNGGDFNPAPGDRGELLSEATMEMFEAARTDTLGQFVASNPEYLNKER
jgi:anionic cell wall polymer biosynthesis LytR-Cps2A-Psr (LCP) family protein